GIDQLDRVGLVAGKALEQFGQIEYVAIGAGLEIGDEIGRVEIVESEGVGTRAAGQMVLTQPADQQIVAIAADEDVVAIATDQAVGSATRIYCVVAIAGNEDFTVARAVEGA